MLKIFRKIYSQCKDVNTEEYRDLKRYIKSRVPIMNDITEK